MSELKIEPSETVLVADSFKELVDKAEKFEEQLEDAGIEGSIVKLWSGKCNDKEVHCVVYNV